MRKVIVTLVFVFMLKSNLTAQSWTSHGPDGGELFSLAVDPSIPNVMYAGASVQTSGVYKTTDGGRTWFALDHGWRDFGGQLVVRVDPLQPQTVYVAGQNSFQVSHDGGANWELAMKEWPYWEGGGLLLEIVPGHPSTLYTDSWKSTDGGVKWTRWTQNFNNATKSSMTSLAIDPTNPSNMYTTTWSSHVLKSLDAGLTWQEARTGLNGVAFKLRLDPHQPSTLYLAAGNGVYRSDDAAETWKLVGLSGTRIYQIAIAADGSVLAASDSRIYKSENRGVSWTELSFQPSFMRDLLFSPSDSKTAFVVGSDFTATHDGGATWNTSNRGLNANVIYTLVLGPDGSTYALGNRVLRSTDGGESWQEAFTNLCRCGASAIAFDPTNPQRIYLASKELNRSDDGGQSWTSVYGQKDNPNPFVQGLSIDAQGTVYMASFNGLLKSEDRGNSWSVIADGRWAGVEASSNDNYLFAWQHDPTDVLYRLSRSGSMKTKMFDGPVDSLRLGSPGSGLIVTGGYSPGNQISRDGGATWEKLWGERDVAIVGSRIYMPFGDLVRVSADSGQSWIETTPSLPQRWLAPNQPAMEKQGINAILVDQAARRTYVSSVEGGVYVYIWPGPRRRSARH